MIYVKTTTKDSLEAALVLEWLKKDESHQSLGITSDQIWDGEVALVHDEDGPIMAIRFQKALRVAVQFNPETKLRNARAGHEVTEWLQQIAKKSGCTEVIVRAGGRAKNFVKRLGFMDFIGQFIGVN